MRKKDREISDPELIEDIILRTEVCRVALCDEEQPYMVSMNFGYLAGDSPKLYFHCAREGRKLDIIKKNNRAYFQMDTDHRLIKSDIACDFTMKFSSVAGSGRLYIVESEEERQKGLNILMKQYSGRDDFSFKPGVMNRTHILRLDIESITGKICK